MIKYEKSADKSLYRDILTIDMLRRKITESLSEWKGRKHKCLLVKGQRQVGKTYSIEQFASENYENYVEYNLSSDKSARRIFDGDLDVDSIISAMGLFSPDVDIKPGSTLIFIDEIQDYPRAKEALKSFTKDGRYDVIASGSMLGVFIPHDKDEEGSWKAEDQEEPLEPSGHIEYMTMYALDFEEFCWANGVSEEHISELRDCIRSRRSIGPAFMERFNQLYRDFMLVGGMPEAVQTFVDTRDYALVGKIQSDLLESCRKDINRYNKGMDRIKTLECFESIPSQLAQSNKKFMFSKVDGGGSRNSAAKYKGNLSWIEGAGYGNMVRSLRDVAVPLRGNEVRDQFKVYLSDTGMLMEMYGKAAKQSLYSDDISYNKGAVVENFVAECLMKSGYIPRYYRKNNGPMMMELDFVIELGSELAVIEVKSGKDRDAPSISKAGKIADVKRRISFEKTDVFVSDDGIEHYPLFAAGFIDSMEKEYDGPVF